MQSRTGDRSVLFLWGLGRMFSKGIVAIKKRKRTKKNQTGEAGEEFHGWLSVFSSNSLDKRLKQC